MADVINKTTKVILRSVHTPDYPASVWAINPTGLAAALHIPQHYRVLSGNTIKEATEGEKTTIDSARLPVLRETVREAYCAKVAESLKASAAKSASAFDADIKTIVDELKLAIAQINAADTLTKLDDAKKLEPTAIKGISK